MGKNKKQNMYDIAMQVIKEECHSCSKWNKCTRVCDRVMAKYKENIKNEKDNL